MIFHITKKKEWDEAMIKGAYEASSLETEGFIHSSAMNQVAGVLERYFENEKDLVLIHIDETKLTAPLKYELAESVQEVFPHIFGPLNLDAVVKTELL